MLQAAGSWSKTACCAANANCGDCGSGCCIDRSASSNFLFRLQPGEPERFLPKGGTSDDATRYQRVSQSDWPEWGWGDLVMGNMGRNGPPGTSGFCDQGTTYAGRPNEACGGNRNWGPTDVEVWFLED